jgi:sterol 14alpha-demethylase
MATLIELPQPFFIKTLATYGFIGLIASILINVFHQFFFRSKTEPPAVFHWVPYIGNAVSYGMDPVAFFTKYQEKVCSSRKTCIDS